MKHQLQVYRAKPNPAGKDRSRQGVKPEQLVGEWVDIKNIGSAAVSFNVMDLHHTKFGRTCSEVTGTESYWKTPTSPDVQVLAVGQILRVYTGSKDYENTLSAEDRGSDITWRAFATQPNFVLNNVCGDNISIFWTDENGRLWRDSAHYQNNPPEGVVLHRIGDKLRPAGIY